MLLPGDDEMKAVRSEIDRGEGLGLVILGHRSIRLPCTRAPDRRERGYLGTARMTKTRS